MVSASIWSKLERGKYMQTNTALLASLPRGHHHYIPPFSNNKIEKIFVVGDNLGEVVKCFSSKIIG